MKLNVLIHDDWELYGDGTGNIEDVMFSPARHVLKICDEFDAHYTFYAEVGQQFAMLNSTVPGHKKQAAAWEELMTNAIKRGHDVQLHFHPQWMNAVFKDGRWALDLNKWSIGALGRSDVERWIRRGKQYLVDLLRPSATDYDVVSFRAGGFMAQPSKTLISVLKDVGINADVTVIKGLKMSSPDMGSIDYSSAPSAIEPWFPAEDEIAARVPAYQNLFCLPTYSETVRRPISLLSLNPAALLFNMKKRAWEKNIHYQPVYKSSASGTQAAAGRPSFLKKFFSERVIVCDFNSIHYSTILNMIDGVIRFGNEQHKPELAVILYSHSKNFFSQENFKSLLSRLRERDEVRFRTTRSLVGEWHRKFSANA